MATKSTRMKGIDLFCGCGGFSEGFEQAGVEIIWGIDNNERTKETFEENHDADMLVADIREVNPEDVGPNPDEVDIIIGGPPCPTFSLVGRTKINSLDGQNTADDERHQLYVDFLRFVDYYNPEVFVMENVKGMMSAKNDDGEPVIDVITGQMKGLGYNTTYQVLDAANFGVPQNRERLFFVGNRKGRENPNIEEWQSHREPKSEDEKRIKFAEDNDSDFPCYSKGETESPWNTVADGILDLPPVVSDGDTPPTSTQEYTMPAVSQYQKWVRDIPSSETWEERVLNNHTCRGHNMRDLSLYKLMGEGVTYKIGDLPEQHQPYRTDIFKDKMKKQKADEPSSTIVAHLYKDGHMFIHPNEARSITVREAARLQSFQDSFNFPVPRTYAFKQVGNAVPPLLARGIATAIIEELF